MSSSGSRQNQRKKRRLQVPASQGSLPGEPPRNQTNAKTFDGPRSYTGTFPQLPAQVTFNPSFSSSVPALNTDLGRVSSPSFQSTSSSYDIPVHTAQPPPPGPLGSLFCSSSDAVMLPDMPLMDTGGSFDAHQWDFLNTNALAGIISGTEAPPGLNAVPNIIQSTVNTLTTGLGAASEQFQSSDLVDHSATPAYAGCSVPCPFPPGGVVKPGDRLNRPQSPRYSGSQAQIQPYVASSLPCNPPSGPSPEAISTNRITTPSEPTNQNEVHRGTPLSSDGIRLEQPLCPVGGTVVAVRRDACVKIRFDMVEISRSISSEYTGLKIPSTLSVKNRGNTSAHKLLTLQILAFGADSDLQYDSICVDCRRTENRPGALSLIDFHSKSDVVLPKNNDGSSIFISFTLHCYPKHYNNNDSGYRLEVLLCDQEQQDSSIVRFRLPYTFNIVAKRTREQFELEGENNSPAPRRQNIRKKINHDNNFVRTVTSGSVGPSTQAQCASGSTGSLGNVGSIPSQINNRTLPPTGVQDRASTAPHQQSPRPIRTTVPSATFEETIDGQDAVIEGTNPGRGPITGGLEIWIYGSNLPDNSRPLYARFGDNATRVSILRPGLLSCKLPSRRDPGKVPVWLSRGPAADAPPFGESLCEFEYYKPLNEIVSTLVRILEVPNPQQASVLEILMKEATSSSQEDGDRGQSGQRGGMSDSDIEKAIIHALEPLQKLPNSYELVSMTNDYNQTLAHFAGLSGYFKLLKQLVEWKTDLTIADANGLTPLHCAYRGGFGPCVELLLDAGASETVLDALGRTPAGFLPDNSELLLDALSLENSTDPIDKKSESNSVTGARSRRSDEGCYSDDSNKARRNSILALHDAIKQRGNPRCREQAAEQLPARPFPSIKTPIPQTNIPNQPSFILGAPCASRETTRGTSIVMGVPHNELGPRNTLYLWEEIKQHLQNGWDPKEDIERHLAPFFEYLGDRDFRCIAPVRPGEVCDWRGAKKDRIISHICGHFNYLAYPCSGKCHRVGCKQRFAERRNLDQHIIKPDLVKCPKCNKTFLRPNLKRHMKVCR